MSSIFCENSWKIIKCLGGGLCPRQAILADLIFLHPSPPSETFSRIIALMDICIVALIARFHIEVEWNAMGGAGKLRTNIRESQTYPDLSAHYCCGNLRWFSFFCHFTRFSEGFFFYGKSILSRKVLRIVFLPYQKSLAHPTINVHWGCTCTSWCPLANGEQGHDSPQNSLISN